MPEFPEVHTITKDLHRILKGSEIKKVEIAENYTTEPNNATFIEKVKGKKITGAQQIAKNILLGLESGNHIHVHLAMSGQVLIKKKDQKLRWERVTWELEKNNKKFWLAYRSIRMFGKVGVISPQEYEKLRQKYGPDPLSKEMTPQKFREIIHSKRTNIKNLLMDQGKIAGLGNIYATEALFEARLHPETRTRNISDAKAKELLEAVQRVIKEGIKNRGSTLEDELYVDVFGNPGRQQDFFRVYGQKRCPHCNAKIQKIKISGRNTYFCPNCQPKEDAGGDEELKISSEEKDKRLL